MSKSHTWDTAVLGGVTQTWLLFRPNQWCLIFSDNGSFITGYTHFIKPFIFLFELNIAAYSLTGILLYIC